MQRHWQDSCWRAIRQAVQVAEMVVVETPSHQVTSQAREIKQAFGAYAPPALHETFLAEPSGKAERTIKNLLS